VYDDLPLSGVSRAAWNEAKRRFRKEKNKGLNGQSHNDGFVLGDAGQILKGYPPIFATPSKNSASACD
jgi:hypothetical protein